MTYSNQGGSSLSDCTLQFCDNSTYKIQSSTNSTQYFSSSVFTAVDFNSAISTCKNFWNGGHLPSFDSLEMKAMIPVSNSYSWTGLRTFYNQTFQSYEWSDGITFNKSIAMPLTLSPKPQGRCIRMDSNRNLGAVTCMTHTQYYCQVDVSHCAPVSLCGAGSAFNLTSSSCQVCPVGKYQDRPATITCVDATVGYFVNRTKATFASQCPAGSYSSQPGSSSCLSCPAGKVSSAGWSSCKDCLLGQYSGQSASVCSMCPQGKYAPQQSSSSCNDCGTSTTPFSGSMSKLDCSICPLGTIGSPLDGLVCKPCQIGMICDQENMTVPVMLNGYYLAECQQPSSTRICDPAEACVVQPSGRNPCPTQCREGYEGPGCGRCSFGFYHLDGKCRRCPEIMFRILFSVGIVAAIFYLAYRFVSSATSIPLDVRLTIKCIQTIALFPNITTKWPSAVLALLQVYSLAVSDTVGLKNLTSSFM
jgi:hypothetical protein